jgi:hypothetical protein
MKRVNQYRGHFRAIAATIALGAAATFTGCGKSGSGVGGSGGGVGGNGGWGGNGSCVPISSPIGFQGNNIYFDSANIIGGWIPQTTQQIGQMTVGGGGGSGPYQRQAVDGTITMNIYNTQQGQYPQQQPYQGFPTGTYNGSYPSGPTQLANAQGTIYISQRTQADIQWRFGGGQYSGGYTQPYFPSPYQQYPTQQQYPQQNYQQVCVSGIAMNLGHYNNYLYGGRVYLYLNNTTPGYILPSYASASARPRAGADA